MKGYELFVDDDEKDLRSVALLRCQVPQVKIGKPRRYFMKGSELFDDDAGNEFLRFNSSELELGNLLGTISIKKMYLKTHLVRHSLL